ncbi:MAG: MFS transporter [Spirochaetota bacterium]
MGTELPVEYTESFTEDAAGAGSGNGQATTLTAIMISVFLMGSGTALQGTAVSLRAGMEGFSDSILGVIMSANYAGLVIGSLLAPVVIRNVGYVRAFAAFASVASASAIAHLLWIDPVVWIVFRGATGLCMSVMLVVVESWLNVSSTSYNRGRILSMYSVMYLGSMGAGQPLLGVFSTSNFEIFGITTVLISLSLVPVALMRVSGEARTERTPPRLIRTFLKSPLAGFGTMVSGLITGATWSLSPRFGQGLGLSDGNIGMLMLLVSLGTLVMQWPLGWISDRKDRRTAIFWSVAVSAAAAWLIALLQSAGPPLYVLMFLFGGFGMPLYSLCIALANDQFSPGEMVQVAGAIIVYYGIGSAAGPFFAGLVMARVGMAGLFLFMGAVLAVLLVFTAVRITVVPWLPRPAGSSYHPYPRTTAAAFQLLRRVGRRRRGMDETRFEGDRPPQ